MNKIIEAGDTLGAAVKITVAVGAVYGVYRLYKLSKTIEQKADAVGAEIDSIKVSADEFVTETVNPNSPNNFINQSVVGDTLRVPFIKTFEFLGL